MYSTDWTHNRYDLCTVNVIRNVKFTLSVDIVNVQLINLLHILNKEMSPEL